MKPRAGAIPPRIGALCYDRCGIDADCRWGGPREPRRLCGFRWGRGDGRSAGRRGTRPGGNARPGCEAGRREAGQGTDSNAKDAKDANALCRVGDPARPRATESAAGGPFRSVYLRLFASLCVFCVQNSLAGPHRCAAPCPFTRPLPTPVARSRACPLPRHPRPPMLLAPGRIVSRRVVEELWVSGPRPPDSRRSLRRATYPQPLHHVRGHER